MVEPDGQDDNTVHALCMLDSRYYSYSGADKSLVRPGRKQATATKEFDVHIAYLSS